MYIHCFMFCFEIHQRQESDIDKNLLSAFLDPASVFFNFSVLTLFTVALMCEHFTVFMLCVIHCCTCLFGLKYHHNIICRRNY